MRRNTAPRKTAKGRSLIFTFLLLLSLPVFVWGLYRNGSFDIRNQAFDDIEVSEDTPCVISFPSVNPYSLELDTTVRVQIDALSKTLGVKRLSVQDQDQNVLFNKEFDNSSLRVTDTFNFTPTELKAYEISGLMVDLDGKTYQCQISSPYDIQGVKIVADNSKPVFTSTPKDSKPSQAISTGTTYEYTLTAQDADADRINYSYSFTPDVDWLKMSVVEDGSDGKLTLSFRGSTDEAASYLANIFIHDGYSKHLASQSWVVSVSPSKNDIPVVTITDPIEITTLTQEDELIVKWDATDFNHITHFEMYVTENPTNTEAWILVNDDINYNQNSYSLDLAKIKDGNYRVIVKAVDNQDPAAEGLGISEEIIIAKGNTETTLDDQVILPDNQVISMTPTSTDTVKNTRPTVKATLVAAEGTTIVQESIVVQMNGFDITDVVSFNKLSESEYTVIYLPEKPLEFGMQKVYITFENDKGVETEKEWTFTIEGGDEDVDDGVINIFGMEITNRNATIIGVGIALVILAIVIPMIIFSVWRDDNRNEENINLPPSTPKSNIPEIETPKSEVENLVDTPEPSSVVTPSTPAVEVAPPEPTFVAPDPEIIAQDNTKENMMSDLEALSKQIEQVKSEDQVPKDNPPTPPEPVF